MKKLLLVLTACLLLAGSADAYTVKKARKKPAGTAAKKQHKQTYYVNGDGTYSTTPTDATRPSPYKGNKVPENDGVKKNKQRNLNYNNGQPQPASDGGH